MLEIWNSSLHHIYYKFSKRYAALLAVWLCVKELNQYKWRLASSKTYCFKPAPGHISFFWVKLSFYSIYQHSSHFSYLFMHSFTFCSGTKINTPAIFARDWSAPLTACSFWKYMHNSFSALAKFSQECRVINQFSQSNALCTFHQFYVTPLSVSYIVTRSFARSSTTISVILIWNTHSKTQTK